MKVLTIEKRKKFEHIIGKEFKETYFVNNEDDVLRYVGNEINNLDPEAYEAHEHEVEDIYALLDGEYDIDAGDFVYYIEIKKEGE